MYYEGLAREVEVSPGFGQGRGLKPTTASRAAPRLLSPLASVRGGD